MHLKVHQMTMIPHHHTYFATRRTGHPGGGASAPLMVCKVLVVGTKRVESPGKSALALAWQQYERLAPDTCESSQAHPS
jgi:hypothetical protein